MQTMLRLRVPTVAVVIGEGSSGGALALGVADRVMMLENSTYSVISPEGGAAILWRDAAQARDAARRSSRRPPTATAGASPTPSSPSPTGGAHRDHDEAARLLDGYLSRALRELRALVAGRASAPAPRALPPHRRLPRDAPPATRRDAAGRSDTGASNGATPAP